VYFFVNDSFQRHLLRTLRCGATRACRGGVLGVVGPGASEAVAARGARSDEAEMTMLRAVIVNGRRRSTMPVTSTTASGSSSNSQQLRSTFV